MWFIFSTAVLMRHLWQLKKIVFLHWCLICAVLLLVSWRLPIRLLKLRRFKKFFFFHKKSFPCHFPLLRKKYTFSFFIHFPISSSAFEHASLGESRELLLKGKDKCSWPPCTKKFKSAAFHNENIIYFFTKEAILFRRSTVLSLPLR